MRNVDIIDTIIDSMSEQLGVNLYLVSAAVAEAENLEFTDADNYERIAGLTLQLNAIREEDTSSSPTLVREQSKERYLKERQVILRYLLTIINEEVRDKREEARTAAKELALTSIKTFNNEFLNVLTLLLLFDGESKYKYLCKPLADFMAKILYNENKEGLPSATGIN